MSRSVQVPVLELPDVDRHSLISYRQRRLLEQMELAGVDAMVLMNPVSLRYAADWREYALFQAHIPTCYLVLRSDGSSVMFGAYADEHDWIGEFRPGHHPNVFDSGTDVTAIATGFAGDVTSVVAADAVVAVERVNPSCVQALEATSVRVVDAEPLVEWARAIKSSDELVCMRHTIAVAEAAIATMRQQCEPGVSENELFAILHQVNVANDGDWIDGRMLCSGPRTNPWYQESSARKIEAGDLLAFDTDMIGPFGYCADISRTWLVGDGEPTEAQRAAYRRAHDEVTHNADLLVPGLTFHELSMKSFAQPDEYIANRYACVVHGVGMSDEWPRVWYRQDWERHGYDGEFAENMVVSVESYIGSEHGGPGVKLEQMYLIEADGASPISSYPYEDDLLA